MVPAEAPCPISGKPSALVQSLDLDFLDGLWRWLGAGSIRDLYGDLSHIGLYESPSGMIFSHPMVEGGSNFYEGFYGRHNVQKTLGKAPMQRLEYIEAARVTADGQAVLEVGCGLGLLRRHIPKARYVGVDPYAPAGAPACVLRQPLSDIVQSQAEAFDAACAFQVVEHIADPVSMVRAMAGAVRPGGLILIGVPLHPAVSTSFPNNAVNAPPHHLTWWTEESLRDLCAATGLRPLSIQPVAASPYEAQLFWLRKLMPINSSASCYFAYRKDWLYWLLFAELTSRVLAALFGLPKDATPVDILLVAQKPHRAATQPAGTARR